MSNIQNRVNKFRYAAIGVATAALVGLTASFASAAPSPHPVTDIVDGVTSDVQAGIVENLPAILGVAGFLLVVGVVWALVRRFIGKR